ncbi:peptide-methionine (S)-S-oxide reductase MsrA [Rickettsiales bacterium LUAb2]
MNSSFIYLAGGCFWGVEAYFNNNNLKAIVLATNVGYANGNIENPTYEQVCTGKTGFTECVQIKYNYNKENLITLLQNLFKIIDPTSLNKQGGDIGTQYRTGIYFINPQDEEVINNYITEQQANYTKKLVIEVMPLKNYFIAEEYHQQYLKKNPNGYCHIPKAMLDNN